MRHKNEFLGNEVGHSVVDTLRNEKNIGIKRVGMDENTTRKHEADVSSRCPSSEGLRNGGFRAAM